MKVYQLRRYRGDDELEGYAHRLRRAAGIEFIQVAPIEDIVEKFKGTFHRCDPESSTADDSQNLLHCRRTGSPGLAALARG